MLVRDKKTFLETEDFEGLLQVGAFEYMLKVNNRNTRKRYEMRLNLTKIKTPERHQRDHSDVFSVNFGHISNLFTVFLFCDSIFVAFVYFATDLTKAANRQCQWVMKYRRDQTNDVTNHLYFANGIFRASWNFM